LKDGYAWIECLYCMEHDIVRHFFGKMLSHQTYDVF
jgi:hypothetical protein